MTGTSVDAVDAALVDFSTGEPTVVDTRSSPLPDTLAAQLQALIHDPRSPALDAWRADALLAEAYAQAALALLADARLHDGSSVVPAQIAAIGSHGQTLWHEPDGDPAFTVQIGDPSRIAERTGIRTVADFRRRDMAAGGQGAPLAPAFHAAALASRSETRAVLNLGGIANLSVIPAAAGLAAGDATSATAAAVIGFDTGPANTLLDAWARRSLAAEMDTDGALARRGRCCEPLLQALLADPYFARAAPKSTGREHFNEHWLDSRGGAYLEQLPAADVMRTLVALTSISVRDAVTRFASGVSAVYVCGGGVRNPVLMDALAADLAPAKVESTQALGIAPDWVEAIAFAWLAWRTINGQPGNLPSVTGARHAAVLGGIYPA